jgi:zinc transport system substrate-binding protein
MLALAAGACADDGAGGAAESDTALEVVAAFYPLEFLANRVGGEQVTVTGLSAPGVEPHDLELTPAQVADISQADLVVFLRSFQPAVDAAVDQNVADRGFDALGAVPLIEATTEDEHAEEEQGEGEEHEDEGSAMDTHVWLDPQRMVTIANELAARLGVLDPDHAAGYTAAAQTLGEELTALDGEFAEGLAGCQRREIVVSHAAFGYLADRYDLDQIAIAGLSPEDEPSPQQIADVAAQAEEHGATTIFFEVLVSPDVAQVIADQVGAETALLDPVEGIEPGSDDNYLSVMRRNLDALRAALGCP